MLANSCWQIQIGVCERRNNMFASCWRKVGENRDKLYFSPTVCQHVAVLLTHTNLSLPTRVGQHWFRVKAVLLAMVMRFFGKLPAPARCENRMCSHPRTGDATDEKSQKKIARNSMS